MDIRFCYYMARIAEEQNLSKAAEKLYITQSALSQQVAKMEQELGTRLFRYQNNKMVLTRAGLIFLDYAKQIIATKETAYQTIANLSRLYTEHISIAISRQTGSFLMSEILPRFKVDYPDVKINISESDTSAAKQLLINGTVDLALMGNTEEPHVLLNEIPLHQEEIVLIVPHEHPLAAAHRQSAGDSLPFFDLRECQGCDFILSKTGTHFRLLVDKILRQHRIIPNIYCEINNFFAVRNMVKNGFGIAFLHRSMVADYDQVCTLTLTPRFVYPHVLAYHKTLVLSEPMKHLITIMKDYCREKTELGDI